MRLRLHVLMRLLAAGVILYTVVSICSFQYIPPIENPFEFISVGKGILPNLGTFCTLE